MKLAAAIALVLVVLASACGGKSSSDDVVFCSGLAPGAKITPHYKRTHPNLYVTRATCEKLTGESS